jgi:hypothetical protein
MFIIRCDRARGDTGVTLWLKTTSPTETWGPRLRAMEFATQREADAVLSEVRQIGHCEVKRD